MEKEVPQFQNVPLIDIFMKELREYLPVENGEKYIPVISQKEQKKVLDRFEHSSKNDASFCFIIDGVEAKLVHPVGIEKILGYKDESFTICDYLESTHPQHRIEHWISGGSIWKFLDKNRGFLSFDNIQFRHSIALKHQHKGFMFCDCKAFIYQISECGKALAYGYEFTILKNWDKEDFISSINDKTGVRDDILDLLNTEKKKMFKSQALFKPEEITVLRHLAHLEENTARSIGFNLEKAKKTIDGYKRNINSKSKIFFSQNFGDAARFAEYLKRQNLL